MGVTAKPALFGCPLNGADTYTDLCWRVTVKLWQQLSPQRHTIGDQGRMRSDAWVLNTEPITIREPLRQVLGKIGRDGPQDVTRSQR